MAVVGHETQDIGTIGIMELRTFLQGSHPKISDADIYAVIERSGTAYVHFADFIRWLYGDEDKVTRFQNALGGRLRTQQCSCKARSPSAASAARPTTAPAAPTLLEEKEAAPPLRGSLTRAAQDEELQANLSLSAACAAQLSSRTGGAPNTDAQPSVGSRMKAARRSAPVVAAGHAKSMVYDPQFPEFILKPYDKVEARNYSDILTGESEPLKPYVASFGGIAASSLGSSSCSLRLYDLLIGYAPTAVQVDIKLGIRTFQEAEVAKVKPRSDLYDKLKSLAPGMLTEEEHAAKAITKHKYMVSRDAMTSTKTLGLRMEGITSKTGSKLSKADLASVVNAEQAADVLIRNLPAVARDVPEEMKRRRVEFGKQVFTQLLDFQVALETSPFVRSHELIGSSILLILDSEQSGVYLIDLVKVEPLPDGVQVDHRSPWQPGNHEDGFLLGMESLINVWQMVCDRLADGELPNADRSLVANAGTGGSEGG